MCNAMLIGHAFDYIALMINHGLTSYKDLATVVDISLDNNCSARNASYILPYRCMFGIINLCYYRSHAWIYMLYKLYKVCIRINQLVFKTKNLNLKRSRD